MADTSNYILGKYIMIAVNAPRKYPSEPVSRARSDGSEQDDSQMTEADQAKLNALLGAFAQKANTLPATNEEAETTKAKEPEDVGHQ